MFSAAAAEVLSHIFPDEAAFFESKSQEAALSRLYGGIHYRFDIEDGNTSGKEVGRYTIDRLKDDGGE